MPRFFAEILSDGTACISGPDAAHISGPLRLKPGDELPLRVADKGFHGRIAAVGKGRIVLDILREEQLCDRSRRKIHLGMSMLAIKDMDTVIRLATELGASDIQPLIAERSNIRDINDHRRARWDDIVREAVKQCQRRTLPCVHEPARLSVFVARAAALWPQRLVALPEAATPLKDITADDVGIIVGPEGGFSPAELELFGEYGFTPVSMGRTVMRAVTAAAVAVGALGLE